MNKIKKVLYTEIEGIIKKYFDEIKAHTGMSNAGVVRYCIMTTWRWEIDDKPSEKVIK